MYCSKCGTTEETVLIQHAGHQATLCKSCRADYDRQRWADPDIREFRLLQMAEYYRRRSSATVRAPEKAL